jgi:hypothetical protein
MIRYLIDVYEILAKRMMREKEEEEEERKRHNLMFREFMRNNNNNNKGNLSCYTFYVALYSHSTAFCVFFHEKELRK